MPPKRPASTNKKAKPKSKKPKTTTVGKAKDPNALHEAIKNNQVTIVKKLLEEGTNVDPKDEDGDTPLFKAVKDAKHLDIIKELLKYGADPMAKEPEAGGYAIHLACGYLGQKAARIEVVEELLKHGADVNAKAYHGQQPLDLISCWVQVTDDTDEDLIAESVKFTKFLLENGANVNANTKMKPTTALYWAVQRGNLPVVQELLKNGADPNISDLHGYTSLHRVCRKIDVAFPGIKEGPNNSKTPEMLAVLIDHGANVNAQDHKGKTPMHHFINDTKLLEKYLEKGGKNIDFKIKDKIGLTALDSTMEKGKIVFPDAAKMIARNMAKGALKRAQTKSKSRKELEHQIFDQIENFEREKQRGNDDPMAFLKLLLHPSSPLFGL